MSCFRKTYVQIDRDALFHNATLMRSFLPKGVGIMAIVKADAYGHGALDAAFAFYAAGVDAFGVALVEEGLQLRQAGFQCPILVLGPLNERGFLAAAKAGLTAVIHSRDCLSLAERAAKSAAVPLRVQLKADTGMGRIGFRDPAAWRFALSTVLNSPWLCLTGAFTHFSDAEAQDPSFTMGQMRRFERLAEDIPKGLCLHAAASAAALKYPWTHLHMVRPGIALYGCAEVQSGLPFRPALRFVAEITAVKWLEAGEPLSYGRGYHTLQRTLVATLAVGYADGISRSLFGKGEVLIKGKRCPIIGRVCMDQMLVDATRVPDVSILDEAVLIGRSGEDQILAQEVARWTGSISYEVLVSPSARVPRRMLGRQYDQGVSV